MGNEAKQLSFIIQAEINAWGIHFNTSSKSPCDLSLQSSHSLFNTTFVGVGLLDTIKTSVP